MKMFSFRVPEQELRAWGIIAGKLGLPMSTWARQELHKARMAALPTPTAIEEKIKTVKEKNQVEAKKTAEPKAKSKLCPHRLPVGVFCKKCP